MNIVAFAQALDKASVTLFGDKQQRTHLGASTLGGCQRAAWFGWRKVQADYTSEARMLRLFHRGHREEEVLRRLLGEAGVELVYPIDSDQWTVKGYRGHLKGSIDFVGRGLPGDEETFFLIECKTHADKYFNQCKKHGVVKVFNKHYVQMQTYMHLGKLTRGLYVAINKNNDDIYLELIEHQPMLAKLYIEKAEKIVEASPIDGLTGISARASHWECRFCDFHKNCFGRKPPSKICRTCVHSQVEDNGGWSCKLGYNHITTKYKGMRSCESWLPGPGFLPNRDVRVEGAKLVEHLPPPNGGRVEYTAPLQPEDLK